MTKSSYFKTNLIMRVIGVRGGVVHGKALRCGFTS